MVTKIADLLEVSLDYLVGKTDVELLVNFSDIGEDIQVEIPQLTD